MKQYKLIEQSSLSIPFSQNTINDYAANGFTIESITPSGEGILLRYLILMSKEVSDATP